MNAHAIRHSAGVRQPGSFVRSRSCRTPPRVQAWLRPLPTRPRYYELLTRLEVEHRTAEEWKDLTRTNRDVAKKPIMTWKSAILFFHGFILYHVIPLSVRYSWYRFWKYLRSQFLYPLQKRWALWDARLDACLCKIGGGEWRYSRAMVSMRLHGKIGPSREMRYRLGLLFGKDIDHCIELFSPREAYTQPTASA